VELLSHQDKKLNYIHAQEVGPLERQLKYGYLNQMELLAPKQIQRFALMLQEKIQLLVLLISSLLLAMRQTMLKNSL